MNIEIANSLFGYFETLYYLNQKLIKLCGVNVIDDFEFCGKEVLDIIQEIPRIIPYSFDKNTQKLVLKDRNGLLEYCDNIVYLKKDYEQILLNNYEFLDKIRVIRNTYQHKMHGINHKSSGSGSFSLFDFYFDINGKEADIHAGSFIKLFKELNILFSKLSKDVSKYAYENGKDDYAYYRRITRFEFTDFNKLYESNLLRTFGQFMKRF